MHVNFCSKFYIIPIKSYKLVDRSIRLCCVICLQKFLEKNKNQIDEIVELVRSKLESGHRITLGALTVIDVHGKFA